MTAEVWAAVPVKEFAGAKHRRYDESAHIKDGEDGQELDCSSEQSL